MSAMREAGRGGWKVSDAEATAFADDLLEYQRSTGSSWGDIAVSSGRKHSSQGWLRDIANGHSPARSNTITEFRGLMIAYPDGVPPGGKVPDLATKQMRTERPISAAGIKLFQRELAEYVISNSISYSDLARICGYERRCGPWLREIAKGRTRAKPDTIARIRTALNANPKAIGFKPVYEGRPKAAPIGKVPSDVPYVPPHIVRQLEIEAKRDAAAADRAAWIEQQRQAELAKYGRTTIDRDIAECVA